MMHLAFISPEYPHPEALRSGGLGTSIKNLAQQLVKRGHKVTVFVAYQNTQKIVIDEGVQVHLIARKNFPIANWYFYKKHINTYINTLIKTEGIQAIEAPDWTGITAFMSFKIPLVVRLNGSDAYFCHIENRPQKKKNYYLEKRNLLNADYILSASTFTATVTKKIFNLTKEIKTIYNSIDASQFLPSATPVQPSTVLYFGAIIRKKGLLDLAQAFNEVVDQNPNAQLRVLGKDVIDYKEGVSTIAIMESLLTAEALKQTTFIGEVTYAEVQNYIAKAAVICLPSYAEAFPMTWLEALSMEKALVSSNIGWAQELMIDEKTGYMMHPSAHENMADAIVQLLSDESLALKMGKQGREHVLENFDTEVVVQQNIDFYKDVIGL